MAEPTSSEIYTLGYELYEAGRYKDAASIFTRLVLTEPMEESFWRGLASSRQMQRKFEEALHAWSLVALLAERDPMPHFHAAECFFALHDPEEAEKALRLAETRLREEDPRQELIQQLRERYVIESRIDD
jgi:type III secretion system low calcium response chaperone LcrH/SycD